ncbi:hypothetical protein Q31a_34370 [Aureliella helgolandensis]|uniref:Uncharacterized protein n=1 Tax=Aureliella helgolandensis TaxID=2527968 RepID=A0A518G943_9BACT|nr:hypothetical protein Q31a_34370 [Aureliella helgolandensis]
MLYCSVCFSPCCVGRSFVVAQPGNLEEDILPSLDFNWADYEPAEPRPLSVSYGKRQRPWTCGSNEHNLDW